ncbi:putative ribonuclease H-like domain-containing protein [Tanacetum coccineum]
MRMFLIVSMDGMVNHLLPFSSRFRFEDGDRLLPGFMRRDIDSLFSRMVNFLRRLCGRETAHALVKKKGEAKDRFYGKLILDLEKAECKKLKKELEKARLSNTFLRMQNERVERDLYWTRVRAHEFYQEMIRRGFVFEERPNEAINVPIEDEKSPLSEPRGSPPDVYEWCEGKKVKFVAATLEGPTLTWWKTKVATMGLETVNQMPWTEMKQLMTAEPDLLVKALYGLQQALRAWYATLSTFLLKSGYRRGTIDKTLFIKKDKNDIIFQMSSMGELTFFLGLQVKQKEDGIFISQDKYVAEILKKFDFASVKTASTPIETHKPLVKDEEASDVDVHLYRSMIGSLMYLTASRPDIMFAVCACSRFQVTPKTSHLNAVKRIFRKSTTGGCQFLGRRLISWQCKMQTIVTTSTTEAEYVAVANCCRQVLWIQNC